MKKMMKNILMGLLVGLMFVASKFGAIEILVVNLDRIYKKLYPKQKS